jgi:hypothetical protein
MSNRRACLTGVYLAGVWLIGVRLKPPSHTGRHCVGWHAVMCYGAPEWFRVFFVLLILYENGSSSKTKNLSLSCISFLRCPELGKTLLDWSS